MAQIVLDHYLEGIYYFNIVNYGVTTHRVEIAQPFLIQDIKIDEYPFRIAEINEKYELKGMAPTLEVAKRQALNVVSELSKRRRKPSKKSLRTLVNKFSKKEKTKKS